MVQQTTGYKIQMFVLFQRTRSLMLGKYTVLPIYHLVLKAQIFTMEEACRICQNFTVSVLYLILEVFSQEYQSTKSRNRRLHMFSLEIPVMPTNCYQTLLQWRRRYDFFRFKTSRLLPHKSVLVIECFLTRSMLFLKCIYSFTLFTVIFHLHNIRNAV